MVSCITIHLMAWYLLFIRWSWRREACLFSQQWQRTLLQDRNLCLPVCPSLLCSYINNFIASVFIVLLEMRDWCKEELCPSIHSQISKWLGRFSCVLLSLTSSLQDLHWLSLKQCIVFIRVPWHTSLTQDTALNIYLRELVSSTSDIASGSRLRSTSR